MKAAKLREMTDEELRQMGRDLDKERSDLRVRKGVGEASGKPVRQRMLRRDIARIQTILREREAGQHG